MQWKNIFQINITIQYWHNNKNTYNMNTIHWYFTKSTEYKGVMHYNKKLSKSWIESSEDLSWSGLQSGSSHSCCSAQRPVSQDQGPASDWLLVAGSPGTTCPVSKDNNNNKKKRVFLREQAINPPPPPTHPYMVGEESWTLNHHSGRKEGGWTAADNYDRRRRRRSSFQQHLKEMLCVIFSYFH